MTGLVVLIFFFSSRRRHTRSKRDWSSDVCSSDLALIDEVRAVVQQRTGVRLEPEVRIVGERSEERRVGKECRSRWWPYHEKKKRSDPPSGRTSKRYLCEEFIKLCSCLRVRLTSPR